MEDITAPKKQSLVWPTLFTDHHDTVEHIQFKPIELTIDDLLFEIETVYPHIKNRLELLVGYPEFEIEMNKLIFSDRENRQGFPKFILTTLLKLSKLHTKQFGHLNVKQTGVWTEDRAK